VPFVPFRGYILRAFVVNFFIKKVLFSLNNPGFFFVASIPYALSLLCAFFLKMFIIY